MRIKHDEFLPLISRIGKLIESSKSPAMRSNPIPFWLIARMSPRNLGGPIQISPESSD